MLYHYTSIESFCKISRINNNIQNHNSTDFLFRTFCIDDMVGQEELSYNYECIRSIIAEVEREIAIPCRLQLSHLEQDCFFVDTNFENWCDFQFNKFVLPYILCFSTNGNNTKFWYPNTNKEVCICLDTKQVASQQHDNIYSHGDLVSYNIDKNKIKYIIKFWYKCMQSSDIEKLYLINDTINEKIKVLSAIRYMIFPFIKPPHFREEEEFRMMYIPNDNDYPVKDDAGRKFIEIKLCTESIKCVKFWESVPDCKIQDLVHRLKLNYDVYLHDRIIYFCHQ